MTTTLALHVTGLTRSFGAIRAVDGVDLAVERGEIMGFLGPNGAGKTTFMNMIMGLVAPDRGEIEFLGVRGGARHRSVRLKVGFLQEKPRVYPEMSARAYLDFFARLYGVPAPAKRVSCVLERVGLAEAADRRLGAYSRGMQQRACLARVMLHDPEFLILDEPTLGLDPSGVVEMRDILKAMRAGGATLFFSSHQLAEMERICDRVAFMKEGRLIAVGSPSELLPEDSTSGVFQVELYESVAPSLTAIRSLGSVRRVRETGRHRAEIILNVRSEGNARDTRATLARELTGLGLTVLSIGTAAPKLEDLFLTLARTETSRL